MPASSVLLASAHECRISLPPFHLLLLLFVLSVLTKTPTKEYDDTVVGAALCSELKRAATHQADAERRLVTQGGPHRKGNACERTLHGCTCLSFSLSLYPFSAHATTTSNWPCTAYDTHACIHKYICRCRFCPFHRTSKHFFRFTRNSSQLSRHLSLSDQTTIKNKQNLLIPSPSFVTSLSLSPPPTRTHLPTPLCVRVRVCVCIFVLVLIVVYVFFLRSPFLLFVFWGSGGCSALAPLPPPLHCLSSSPSLSLYRYLYRYRYRYPHPLPHLLP